MRPRLVDTLVECDIRASQRVEGKRADHVRGIRQNLRRQQRQHSDRQHALRAVNQRDRFLGFEHQRFDLGAPHGVGCGNPARLFFAETLTFSDQRQRQVCQRSQIAARSHAALRRAPSA